MNSMDLRKLLSLSEPLMIFFCLLVITLPIGSMIKLELIISNVLGIMKNLERPETCNGLRTLFDRGYNFSELLDWEHERLNYTRGSIERYENPLKIIEYGKGRCREFAILYVALTLAHGYQSRLVFDIYGDHSWAEVKLHGEWVHVDPTQKEINNPYMYQENWGKELWLVLAFWNGTVEDVTDNYKT